MPDVLTLVLAQLSPKLRHTQANLETMGRIVAEHSEADLVVFPELFLSGYTLSDIDELAVQWIAQSSRGSLAWRGRTPPP